MAVGKNTKKVPKGMNNMKTKLLKTKFQACFPINTTRIKLL
jgi:hypothetical protein